MKNDTLRVPEAVLSGLANRQQWSPRQSLDTSLLLGGTGPKDVRWKRAREAWEARAPGARARGLQPSPGRSARGAAPSPARAQFPLRVRPPAEPGPPPPTAPAPGRVPAVRFPCAVTL